VVLGVILSRAIRRPPRRSTPTTSSRPSPDRAGILTKAERPSSRPPDRGRGAASRPGQAGRVAPYRLPKTLAYAATLFLLAVGMLAWPVGSAGTPRPAPPRRPLDCRRGRDDCRAAQGARRAGQIGARPELEKLVKELIEKAEEMKQPGVDLKEALAKLSEMQAKIAAQQAQYNVGLVDAQLPVARRRDAGRRGDRPAGSALQEGKFDQAVKELEKLETRRSTRKRPRPSRRSSSRSPSRWARSASARWPAPPPRCEGPRAGRSPSSRRPPRPSPTSPRGTPVADGSRPSSTASSTPRRVEVGPVHSEFTGGQEAREVDLAEPVVGASTSGNVLGDKTKLQANRKSKRSPAPRAKARPRWRRPTPPKASSSRPRLQGQLPEVQEDVRGRARQRAHPPRPSPDHRKYFELIRPAGGDSAAPSKDAPAASDKK